MGGDGSIHGDFQVSYYRVLYNDIEIKTWKILSITQFNQKIVIATFFWQMWDTIHTMEISNQVNSQSTKEIRNHGDL